MYERDANYLALDSSTHSLQILKGVGHLTQLVYLCQYRRLNCLSIPVIRNLQVASSVLIPNSVPI